jgi:NADH-quinone oxidoreductase subunit J
MMLDLKVAQLRRIKLSGLVAGAISVLAIGAVFWLSMSRSELPAATTAPEGSAHALGTLLFTKFALPFEILSALLLVAMVGVILLSKKDLK